MCKLVLTGLAVVAATVGAAALTAPVEEVKACPTCEILARANWTDVSVKTKSWSPEMTQWIIHKLQLQRNDALDQLAVAQAQVGQLQEALRAKEQK